MRIILIITTSVLLSGCGIVAATKHASTYNQAELSKPNTKTYRDLLSLPEPMGKISVAVYGFRDMTGQYKSSPDSNISTVVTQGAASMLTQALKDSGWFVALEREGLQDLLTERKVHRALRKGANGKPNLTPLIPANIIFEGGIIAYDTNFRTGGLGAKYLGIGGTEQYRVDQVTIILRTVNVRDGSILDTVQTSKTILSEKVDINMFKYVAFKDLLQAEMGFSYNEPVQLCAQEAIQAAVVHMIVRGVEKKLWRLKNKEDIDAPLMQEYSSNVPLMTKKIKTHHLVKRTADPSVMNKVKDPHNASPLSHTKDAANSPITQPAQKISDHDTKLGVGEKANIPADHRDLLPVNLPNS